MASIRDVIEGLEILAKYAGGEQEHIGGADHDVIWGPPVPSVELEDKARLEDLGWHWSGEYQCWVRFC